MKLNKKDREKLIVDHFGMADVVLDRLLLGYRSFKFMRSELLSEAYVALVRAADSFDEEKGVLFKTWASLKMRGAIIDLIRKHKKVTTPLFDINSIISELRVDDDNDYDEDTIKCTNKNYTEEDEKKSWELVDLLEPKDPIMRDIYLLNIMGNVTLREISEDHGLHIENIKSRKIRLRKALTEQLKELGKCDDNDND